ncbi:MAG: phage protease [Planctomycetota bacterium]
MRKEIVIFQPGPGRTTRGETYQMDAQAARQVIREFSRSGGDLLVDYDHETICPELRGPEGAAPAAGWIKRLRWDPARGLVGSVDFTERGSKAIAASRYRYHSPAFYTDRDGRVVQLISLALTNSPATIGARPLAASQAAARLGFGLGKPHRLLVCGNPGNGPDDNASEPPGEADEPDVVILSGETLALVAGFLDYAAEALPGLSEFLNDSEGIGREAWLKAADVLFRDVVFPGRVAMAAELLSALNEIAEHRELLTSVSEDITARRGQLADRGHPATNERTGAGMHMTVYSAQPVRAIGGDRGFQGARGFDPALRAEFGDAETHAAFVRANRAGLVNILTKTKQTRARHETLAASRIFDDGDPERALRFIFNSSPHLQTEFVAAETFIAFECAAHAGNVQICGRR